MSSMNFQFIYFCFFETLRKLPLLKMQFILFLKGIILPKCAHPNVFLNVFLNVDLWKTNGDIFSFIISLFLC